ncbi:MAG: NmrA/HSCARG family protein [Povalibacter sp.]
MSSPIITVFGSTGTQGGSLAQALLSDPQKRFAVRAVTRKPESPAAQKLRQSGAEIVVADLDDSCSVYRALEGAYGAFFVTNFWEHFSAEKELTQAHVLASAASQAGIQHAIWSTLEDTREFFAADGSRMPVLQARYNVPHFDAKGEANRYFVQQRVPTTFLYTSGYFENLIYFGLGPKRRTDGSLAVRYPTADRKIPWVAAEDIGRSAFQVFARGDSMAGVSIGIAGDHLTGTELADGLASHLKEPVSYEAVSADAYRASGEPGADELGNMFQFKRDFETQYRAQRDLERARALNPQMQTFKQWLARHAAQIPVA